jgi:hypothetical protein
MTVCVIEVGLESLIKWKEERQLRIKGRGQL